MGSAHFAFTNDLHDSEYNGVTVYTCYTLSSKDTAYIDRAWIGDSQGVMGRWQPVLLPASPLWNELYNQMAGEP